MTPLTHQSKAKADNKPMKYSIKIFQLGYKYWSMKQLKKRQHELKLKTIE